MSEEKNFGFCPRCGALMHDGACRSCGYRGGGYTNYPPVQQPKSPEKKNRKGLILALCIVCAVVLFIGLILAFAFLSSTLTRVAMETEIYEEEYDDPYSGDYFDEFGDYDSGYYVPDEDDPYYREITDCTRTDLEYGISWIVDSITPDDDEDYCTYYATYPLLKGGDGAYDSINEEITGKALQYKEAYTDYPGGCSTYGYVTYMDESKISVVFQHDLYEENGTLPRVTAVTFDLESGQEIKPEQMTAVDEELVMRFRAQNETQNGGVEFVENSSDEDLLALLRDPQTGIFFYSPVGLEAGFNYESGEYSSGWVTVTLKDQAL